MVIDHFSAASLRRLLGDMPGSDRLAAYLEQRARRELAKLPDERLEQYLTYLAGIMTAIRTGENFDQLVALMHAPPETEEPAA